VGGSNNYQEIHLRIKNNFYVVCFRWLCFYNMYKKKGECNISINAFWTQCYLCVA